MTLKAFYGVKEVTWAEYDAFAFSLDLHASASSASRGPRTAATCLRPTHPTPMSRGGGARSPTRDRHHSVRGVALWRALGAHRKKYRLPTEAEWESPPRWHETAYSFVGDAAQFDYAWLKSNSQDSRTSAGRKRPILGLFDARQRAEGRATSTMPLLRQVPADNPSTPRKALYRTSSAAGRGTTSRRAEKCGAGRRRGLEQRDPQNPEPLVAHRRHLVGFRVVAETVRGCKITLNALRRKALTSLFEELSP